MDGPSDDRITDFSAERPDLPELELPRAEHVPDGEDAAGRIAAAAHRAALTAAEVEGADLLEFYAIAAVRVGDNAQIDVRFSGPHDSVREVALALLALGLNLCRQAGVDVGVMAMPEGGLGGQG